MSPAASPDSLSWSIAQYFFQINGFGPLFLIVGIFLASWLIYLVVRPRSSTGYYISLAASCYPLLIGIVGASWGGVRYFAGVSWQEFHNQHDPDWQMAIQDVVGGIRQILLCLLLGAAITCLFLLLNVVAIQFRKPNRN
jgi:hypothetical protein